jgi:ribosome-associated toxin RatA of RatAB toxin-antitoxin module
MAEFGGRGTVDVAAGRERCFAVASNLEGYPEWHPVIESISVSRRDAGGRPSLARAVVDASVSTVKVEISVRYEPPDRVRLERESGDLKEMWTEFELVELDPDRTRVEYSTSLDPGRMLSMLAKGPVLEKVRHKLVDEALAGFKQAAESG